MSVFAIMQLGTYMDVCEVHGKQLVNKTSWKAKERWARACTRRLSTGWGGRGVIIVTIDGHRCCHFWAQGG